MGYQYRLKESASTLSGTMECSSGAVTAKSHICTVSGTGTVLIRVRVLGF